MSQMPQWGGEAELTTPPTAAQPEKFVKVQETAPMLVALQRAAYQALVGAVGGLLLSLQMGARQWPDLLWGVLIGACAGFLGRSSEGGVDQLSAARARPDQTVAEVEDRERRYIR